VVEALRSGTPRVGSNILNRLRVHVYARTLR